MEEVDRQRPTPRRPRTAVDDSRRQQLPRVWTVLVAIAYHPMMARAAVSFLIAALGAGVIQLKLWTAQRRSEAAAVEAKVKAAVVEARVDNTIKVSTNPLVDDVAAANKRIDEADKKIAALQELALSFVVTGHPSPKKRQLVKAVAANAEKAGQELKARADKKNAPRAQKVPEEIPEGAAGKAPPVPLPVPDGSAKS